jgi:hypothetical protein
MFCRPVILRLLNCITVTIQGDRKPQILSSRVACWSALNNNILVFIVFTAHLNSYISLTFNFTDTTWKT